MCVYSTDAWLLKHIKGFVHKIFGLESLCDNQNQIKSKIMKRCVHFSLITKQDSTGYNRFISIYSKMDSLYPGQSQNYENQNQSRIKLQSTFKNSVHKALL